MTDTETRNPFAPLRISDLSDDDKPREKALRQGIRSLSDAELVAIIFGGGLPGVSVIDMARSVLRDCDNRVDLLADLSMDELMRKYKGVGPAKAVSLAAAFELGRRNTESAASHIDPLIRSSHDIVEIMRPVIGSLKYEEFWVLMLSRANRVTCKRCVSQGGTVATVVDTKLVVKHAVDALASGMVLVHNHPSGNNLPSPQDDSITRKIKECAQILDVKVLDHVIVTRNGYYSYADNGRL